MTPTSAQAMGIDVVVPTYRRPEQIRRCLQALDAQAVPPAQIFVVVRREDHESAAALATARAELPNLSTVTVDGPGVVAAMSAGVAASSSAIVAFTDDDAEPRADWIERLLAAFADPTVGGVGGRDHVWGEPDPSYSRVGVFNRSGRPVANHHLGVGGARDAQFLKGVNFAFRSEALAMPRGGLLKGSGAQVDFEMLMCGWALSRGWRLIYDSDLVVDHFPARRLDGDQRGRPDGRATFNAAYNSVVAIALGRLGRRHPERVLYPILVGGRDRPGLVRALAAVLRGESDVLSRVGMATAGHLTAVMVLPLISRRPAAVAAGELRRGRAQAPASGLARSGARATHDS